MFGIRSHLRCKVKTASLSIRVHVSMVSCGQVLLVLFGQTRREHERFEIVREWIVLRSMSTAFDRVEQLDEVTVDDGSYISQLEIT